MGAAGFVLLILSNLRFSKRFGLSPFSYLSLILIFILFVCMYAPTKSVCMRSAGVGRFDLLYIALHFIYSSSHV